jgi:hypothetical protein
MLKILLNVFYRTGIAVWMLNCSISVFFVFLISCSSEISADFAEDNPDTTADSEPVDFYEMCTVYHCSGFTVVTDDLKEDLDRDVPTWNEHDPGFGLSGNPMYISASDNNTGPGDPYPLCYSVKISAHREDDVQFSLEVTWPDGQKIKRPIRAHEWEVEAFEFKGAETKGIMKFTLIKEGNGRVILYFAEVKGIYYCDENAVAKPM